jgi:hypothetical protein
LAVERHRFVEVAIDGRVREVDGSLCGLTDGDSPEVGPVLNFVGFGGVHRDVVAVRRAAVRVDVEVVGPALADGVRDALVVAGGYRVFQFLTVRSQQFEVDIAPVVVERDIGSNPVARAGVDGEVVVVGVTADTQSRVRAARAQLRRARPVVVRLQPVTGLGVPRRLFGVDIDVVSGCIPAEA